MQSLIVVSVLFFTVAIPAMAANAPSERRGFGRVLLGMAVFLVLYLLSLRFLYPRLG